MNRNLLAFRCIACVVGLAGLTKGSLAAPVTAEEILANFPGSVKETVDRGDIVSIARSEQEVDPSGLVISLAIKVPAPLAETTAKLRTLSTSKDPNEKIVLREIRAAPNGKELAAAFADLAFSDAEQKELNLLLGAGPGDEFNLSTEEIGWFNQAAALFKPGATPTPALAEAMAATYRRVLASRYAAYRTGGLDGIAPYARKKGAATSPGKELISTTETMGLLRTKHPELYQAVRNYPAKGDYVQHRYFWVKSTVEGRPLFALKHEMARVEPDFVYIVDRHYYMSQTLNALQVAIVCLPYQGGTLVGLVNQSFVDKVGGSSIGRRIGRRIVESETKPLFERLKAAFPKR